MGTKDVEGALTVKLQEISAQLIYMQTLYPLGQQLLPISKVSEEDLEIMKKLSLNGWNNLN